MNFSRLSLFLIVLACMFLVVPSAQSASIKDRMAARIPAIDALKSNGIIGENNNGYLEFRTADRANEKLIAEENADRTTVYAAIGKKQGASAELVGKRRAIMIAEKPIKGHWYQSPDGKWYKK